MLTIDLGRLARETSLRVDVEVPADDPLWSGMGLVFDGPVSVDITVTEAVSGEVVARGSVRGTLRHECRRCVKPILSELSEDLTVVFLPVDESDDEADGPADGASGDPEVRPIPGRAVLIDLGDAIREELILEVDRYAVCDPECRGLCPRCGADLNRTSCDCSVEERDPRWDALRALNTE